MSVEIKKKKKQKEHDPNFCSLLSHTQTKSETKDTYKQSSRIKDVVLQDKKKKHLFRHFLHPFIVPRCLVSAGDTK